MRRRILLKGGTVIDGTGAPRRPADVLVEGERIVAVGARLTPSEADVLDAAGCFVTPGFIDIHSHSDFTLLADPRAVSSITQGVTLEVIGNCGWGCALVGNPTMGREVIYGYRPEPPISWSTTAGYLDALAACRPAVNVITLVPNGQLRLSAVGLEQRPASADERAVMRRLLQRCLDEGAAGFSTGLEYPSESGATEEEVTELCRIVARCGGIYATHTRNRDAKAVEAVAEAIRSAAHAGVRLQISHITPRGGMADTAQAIELVDAARRLDQDVAFDMHTRLFGTTYLKVLLPLWAVEGSPADVAKRLAEPTACERIRQYRENPIAALRDWSRVVLLDNPGRPELSRRSLEGIADEWGMPPFECALEILRSEAECGQLRRQMVILHTYSEDLLGFTYEHPHCTVGSDATALAPDGPLAGSAFHGAYTWAAWFYRRMIRETGRFTPEEGIRKLSGASAERLGLAGRGTLAVGQIADLAVFDPESFADTGTTFEPSQVAAGMRHVLVNGSPTVRDGRLTGARSGTVLRSPL